MMLWLPQDPAEVPHLLCLTLPRDILHRGVLLVRGTRDLAFVFGLFPVPPGLKFPLELWVTQLLCGEAEGLLERGVCENVPGSDPTSFDPGNRVTCVEIAHSWALCPFHT